MCVCVCVCACVCARVRHTYLQETLGHEGYDASVMSGTNIQNQVTCSREQEKQQEYFHLSLGGGGLTMPGTG